MASAGQREGEAPVPSDVSEDAVRDEPDAEMSAGDTVAEPVEAPAPRRSRRPNRGAGRRRQSPKK
jgi:hypothetical protein